MPECIIAGTVVKFPFEPYDVQRDYMEKVIMCLRDRTNGVLESPTGTGKTLSLLCSSLAWLLAKKKEIKSKMENVIEHDVDNRNEIGADQDLQVPKIIYASRTHSQLAQAVQELKRSSYSAVKAVVLGSRDQLCIHPEVVEEPENAHKIQMCKFLVQSHKCSYIGRIESKKSHPDFCGSSIMDIEDLVRAGQKLKMCPYYAAKQLVDEADIVFMPYQYLFDPAARQANQIQMSNAICILDEAHNIEKVCEETASGHIKSSDLAMAIEDSNQILKLMAEGKIEVKNTDSDIEVSDVISLKEMLLKLEKAIDQIEVKNKEEGTTFPAAYIFQLLEQANITFSSSKVILQLLDKLVQLMVLESQNNHLLRKGGSFLRVGKLLSCVFNCDEADMAKIKRSFKVHVQFEDSDKQPYPKSARRIVTSTKKTKIVNYWCFNPGFGMEQLLKTNPRSIILTSGTLAPLKPLIAELNLTVSQRLENPHIVNASQVFCKIVGYGPDREQLISNYQNRDNPRYINSLGSTILNVARIVPDGLLVFFPSYTLLHQCVNSWRASGIWTDISRSKPIFIEPRAKDDFVVAMDSFYESIEDSKGACFMAVCRGKVSEGLDFIDRNGRAVIITGLPFPPLKDPKVILKKKYLEENRSKENGLLTGAAWYSLEATRAVNQAIGRVIRHRKDYGAILLCDSRFQQPTQVQQLSKWIRDILGSTPKCSAFTPVVEELRNFFKNTETIIDKSPKQCCNKFSLNENFKDSKEELKYSADSDTKFQNDNNRVIIIEEEQPISSTLTNGHCSNENRICTPKQFEDTTPLYRKYFPNSGEFEYLITGSQHSQAESSINDNNVQDIDREFPNSKYVPDSNEILINNRKFTNTSPPNTKDDYAIALALYNDKDSKIAGSPYDEAETSIRDHIQETDSEFLYSKYFSDSDEIETNQNSFQNVADNAAILIDDDEEEHTISCRQVSVSTAGQTGHMKLSRVMDNSSVLPSCSGSSSSSSVSVKINKREHRASKCAPLLDEREAINLKKIKVEENYNNTQTERLNLRKLHENTICPSQSSYSNTQTQSVVLTKKLPEGRVEFLNLLRKLLTPTDFADFTEALMYYKHNDDINILLDLLFRLFGQSQLLYVLHGMRRFLRVQHRSQFDRRVADLCCIYNDEEFASIKINDPFM